jgi:hypothetical protein
MSKIVTLTEGDTEIYPVTSAEAIFDKVKTGNIQDSAVTTIKLGNNAVTAIKLASNSVATGKIADKAVTYDKIDGSTVKNLELIYSYVQGATSSAIENIDIPVDLTVYKYLQLNVFYEAGSGSGAWDVISVLNSSKTAITCHQCGIEADNTTTLSGINRENTQLIAVGTSANNSTCFDVLIQCGNNINYPIAFCRSFGGTQRWQDFKVRIMTNPSNVKYIEVPLYYAKDGGRILLWGIKGEDMGL